MRLSFKIKNFFFCLRYPFWKLRNVWTGKCGGYVLTWYDFIPDGWCAAFGKQLSRDIKKAGNQTRKRLKKYIPWKKLIFWQDIKSKYGELRLYAIASEEIMDVLEKYELLSYGYCEICGEPARYKTRGWVQYLCDDCFNAYLKDKDEGMKNKLLTDCRLKPGDIPNISSYDQKSGKYIDVDLKKNFGIDFKELWGLKD